MISKLITLLLFGIWFKLYNIFFYSFFNIPVEFVTGEGINQYKLYWLVFFITLTVMGIKLFSIIYKISSKRSKKP